MESIKRNLNYYPNKTFYKQINGAVIQFRFYLFFVFIAVLMMGIFSTNAQECQWTRQLSSSNSLDINTTELDKLGNLFIAGNKNGKLKVQSTDSDIILDEPEKDLFVVKYNSLGKIELVIRNKDLPRMNNGIKIFTGLKIDNLGYIILVGYERLGSYSNNADMNGFIIKFNQENASTVWFKQLGFGVIPNDLNIDDTGNIYITGQFSTVWDTKKQKYETYGKDDIMLEKFNSNGKPLWLKTFGGESWDRGIKIMISDNNQLILVGTFIQSANFDDKVLESSIMGDIGEDIFIAFLSPMGECKSLHSLGSLGNDVFSDAYKDQYDNLYIRGYAPNDLRLDSKKIITGDSYYDNVISNNYYIVTFNNQMKFLNYWMRQNFWGTVESLQKSAVDSKGNIFYLFSNRLAKEWSINSKTELPGYNIFGYFIQNYPENNPKELSSNISLFDIKILSLEYIFLLGGIGDDANIGGCDLFKKGMKDYFVSKLKISNDEDKKESKTWPTLPVEGFANDYFSKEDLFNRIYNSYGSTDRGWRVDKTIYLDVYVNKKGIVEKVKEYQSANVFYGNLEKIIYDELYKTKFKPYMDVMDILKTYFIGYL